MNKKGIEKFSRLWELVSIQLVSLTSRERELSFDYQCCCLWQSVSIQLVSLTSRECLLSFWETTLLPVSIQLVSLTSREVKRQRE